MIGPVLYNLSTKEDLRDSTTWSRIEQGPVGFLPKDCQSGEGNQGVFSLSGERSGLPLVGPLGLVPDVLFPALLLCFNKLTMQQILSAQVV